ncbi:class F sortase [Kribbella sp. CA-294648]|uniref:class F sortase n=1 Tax=Kribbella sp. CA-294648 TaxID=3239948 RepID=UPI003D8C7B4C
MTTGLVLAIGGTWLQLSSPDSSTRGGDAGAAPDRTVALSNTTAGVVPAAASVARRKAGLPGVPERVVIGRLGVVAPVVAVGLDAGALTPPSNPRNVGWWSGGVRPGALRGTAVITGHTVHAGGGAFDELERLRAGDRIEVSTSRGVLNYRVAGVSTYRKQPLARRAAELFDQSGPGRLVLVTCEDWNGRTYLSNVVVVARLMA